MPSLAKVNFPYQKGQKSNLDTKYNSIKNNQAKINIMQPRDKSSGK